MMLIVMAFEVFYSFVVVFITCELGQRLICEYADIEDVICQFDWYLLPLDIQKALTIIIFNAQQPVTIECFGSTNTNRESFQQVCLMRKRHMQNSNHIQFNVFNGMKLL